MPRDDLAPRYTPSARLRVLTQAMSSRAHTLLDVMALLDCSRATAARLLQSVKSTEKVEQEDVEGRTAWRVVRRKAPEAVPLSTTQLVAFFLARQSFEPLKGTGIKEDLDDAYALLHASLRKSDADLARDLERKLHHVSEAPHVYDGRSEHVDDALTAILRQEELDVVFESRDGTSNAFTMKPYTLLLFRLGLYIVGHSERHGSVRTFALEGFRSLARRRGAQFEYPTDYHPSAMYNGAFGLFVGPRTKVRVRFDASVAYWVERRRWHPTQKIVRESDGALVVTMEPAGTTEVATWVLGFGPAAEVLEPAKLREEIAEKLRKAAARYA